MNLNYFFLWNLLKKFLKMIKFFIELNVTIFIITSIILILGLDEFSINWPLCVRYIFQIIMQYLQQMDWNIDYLKNSTETFLRIWYTYLNLYYHFEPYTNPITKLIADNVRELFRSRLEFDEHFSRTIIYTLTILAVTIIISYWAESFSICFKIADKSSKIFTPNVTIICYIYVVIILVVDLSLLIHKP